MPILWRYLLSSFLKVTFFCVLSFVAILLTMRLDEIAHFAALGAPIFTILQFTLYQVPYILPIAIPISGLIASLLLIQRLSSTHELTALRASGFALRNILAPIFFTAAFLFLVNFWLISEVATQSHLKTGSLKDEMRSVNPLLILNNKHFMRLKGVYFTSLGSSQVGESATDAILALPNSHRQRLNLLLANNLKASPETFTGKGITLISSLPSDKEDSFDHLLIENMEESVTLTEEFSRMMQKKSLIIRNDHLKTSFMLLRLSEIRNELQTALLQDKDSRTIKQLKHRLAAGQSEIVRRFSLGFAAFTFTLLGAALGINISRNRKNSGLYAAIALTVFFLLSFFVAKGTEHNFPLATGLYIGPHIIIIGASLFALRKATRGIE